MEAERESFDEKGKIRFCLGEFPFVININAVEFLVFDEFRNRIFMRDAEFFVGKKFVNRFAVKQGDCGQDFYIQVARRRKPSRPKALVYFEDIAKRSVGIHLV